jgi:hypothetical protein
MIIYVKLLEEYFFGLYGMKEIRDFFKIIIQT